MAGSLNDVSIQIPHMMKTGADAEAEMRAVRKRYDEWTWKAAEELNRRFSDREIAGQLRAGRYRAILTAPLGEARLMLYAEIAELQDYFRSLANQLRAMQERYGRGGAVRYVVLDTNTTLHFTRFDKILWQKVFGKGTALVVPHVVVDEIDTKSYQTGDKKISRRARGVFRLLESVLEAGPEEAIAEDGTPVFIMTDEPGHARLAVPDDELVASALRLYQAVAPAEVVVVSRDIGVRTRARAWGLPARPLPDKYLIEGGELRRRELEQAAAELVPGGGVSEQPEPPESAASSPVSVGCQAGSGS
ncbi:PIN domain-containing protein [Streptomyces albogriseolus]|uniref:PIN domain-containing protein n=1 Tax=Streptomyces albogriseolus TaxID=1887 RepID=UPI0022556858|nr:PIN domain-containing protein [Streptomyces viridodiastaticus]MCX4625009.1 PIN domain-containing protein [Streptomyces viridodiastaticus]